MRTLLRALLPAALACAFLISGLSGFVASGRLALRPCHLDDLNEEVACGTISVFEDRVARAGRRLDVHFAVLPAVRRAVRPDPLFIMAGGPGQGARSYAGLAARSFRTLRRSRDIVLVDLRGTGASSPLDCPVLSDELESITRLSANDPRAEVMECLERLAADPRHFTHVNALADLEDVRSALGYQQINMWGGSWGTRAALLYATWYPGRVRSLVLDGAVPAGMGFPDNAAEDAQRALDALLLACEQDDACNRAFPTTRADIAASAAALDRETRTAVVRHPRTNRPISIRVSRTVLAEMVRMGLYSPVTASRLPALLRLARDGDYGPLVAQSLELASATTATMAAGATMAILCSEDIRGSKREERVPHVFFDSYAAFWRSRCQYWPAGPPLPEHQPVVLSMPALILSGGLDPVTPPRWGELMSRTFARHAHVVAPGAAHNTSFSGCMPELIAEFVESGAPESLDTRCASKIERPPFVVSAAGSRP